MKQQPVFTVRDDIATQVAVWNMGRQLGKINKKQPPLDTVYDHATVRSTRRNTQT